MCQLSGSSPMTTGKAGIHSRLNTETLKPACVGLDLGFVYKLCDLEEVTSVAAQFGKL